MVVEPAQRGQVLRVRPPAVGPGADMVNLEAVAARTTRNGARGAVAVQDPSSQPR